MAKLLNKTHQILKLLLFHQFNLKSSLRTKCTIGNFCCLWLVRFISLDGWQYISIYLIWKIIRSLASSKTIGLWCPCLRKMNYVKSYRTHTKYTFILEWLNFYYKNRITKFSMYVDLSILLKAHWEPQEVKDQR